MLVRVLRYYLTLLTTVVPCYPLYKLAPPPFGFPSTRKRPPLDILKLLVTTLRNQDKKVPLIQVDRDGPLERSSEFTKTYHDMNIIVQTTGGDASSINGIIESSNKTIANITRDILLNSIHKK